MIESDEGFEKRAWWKRAVVSQVYLRSFAESDGNGIGDLPGLIATLDHLASLGVDCDELLVIVNFGDEPTEIPSGIANEWARSDSHPSRPSHVAVLPALRARQARAGISPFRRLERTRQLAATAR